MMKKIKFLWRKWISSKEYNQCRHLCIFCKWRKEHYIECINEITEDL